ncbi:MAG: hypothetical protein AAB916_01975 [Patescibacteria group bacterium]
MKQFMFPNITFTIQVFREGQVFVAHNSELNVSSCGDTMEEARKNLKDAVRGFLKSAHKMGTLQNILEDAGYYFRKNGWQDPQLMVMDRFSITA